jgi:hypothetical protein
MQIGFCCAGVLEPGEARVCQVSLQAGLQPQLFSGEIYCHAAEAQCSSSPHSDQAGADAAGMWAQGLTLQQWQLVDGEAEEAEDEEIIAQDPPRLVVVCRWPCTELVAS